MNYCPESVGEAPYAVSALIINGDKILAVSRKNNHADFGLPGGKLDPGEGFKEALIREVMEETGLLVTALEPVYGAYCGTEGVHKVHWTMTYLCRVSGEINTKEAGLPRWVNPNTIIANKGVPCSFAEYNIEMFQSLTKMNDATFLRLQTDISIDTNYVLED
jgi:8-oxo-dGTP pyrophosphatase MutT (NUDIX family)